MRRAALLVPVTVLIAALLVAGREQPLAADGPEAVTVTNFPEVQRVRGVVEVAAPIPQTRLEQLGGLVGPGTRTDPASYVDAGALTAEGFAAVTLGLAGEVQGRLLAPATIGALLVPDVPEILATFREHGIAQFALEVQAQASATGPGIFQSEQVHLRLGFPRYRVLLYNGSPRTAAVTVYAYLGGS